MSLFPPLVLKLYKILISPLAGGKIAAMMVGEFFFYILLVLFFSSV